MPPIQISLMTPVDYLASLLRILMPLEQSCQRVLDDRSDGVPEHEIRAERIRLFDVVVEIYRIAKYNGFKMFVIFDY